MQFYYERKYHLPPLLPDGYFNSFVEQAKTNYFIALYQTRSNIYGLRTKLRLSEEIEELADPRIFQAVENVFYQRQLRTAIAGEERILEALKEYRNATKENEYQSKEEPEQTEQASGAASVPRARRWVRASKRFGDSYQF